MGCEQPHALHEHACKFCKMFGHSSRECGSGTDIARLHSKLSLNAQKRHLEVMLTDPKRYGMFKCRVNDCKDPMNHVTNMHRCNICTKNGHDQVECPTLNAPKQAPVAVQTNAVDEPMEEQKNSEPEVVALDADMGESNTAADNVTRAVSLRDPAESKNDFYPIDRRSVKPYLVQFELAASKAKLNEAVLAVSAVTIELANAQLLGDEGKIKTLTDKLASCTEDKTNAERGVLESELLVAKAELDISTQADKSSVQAKILDITAKLASYPASTAVTVDSLMAAKAARIKADRAATEAELSAAKADLEAVDESNDENEKAAIVTRISMLKKKLASYPVNNSAANSALESLKATNAALNPKPKNYTNYMKANARYNKDSKGHWVAIPKAKPEGEEVAAAPSAASSSSSSAKPAAAAVQQESKEDQDDDE